MKITLAVFAVLVACVAASGRGYGRAGNAYDRYNRDGFKRVGNGISAPYSNDDRQRAVNRRAEHIGASSGTADYYDVPGANRDFGYSGYGYNRGSNGGYNDGYRGNDYYQGGRYGFDDGHRGRGGYYY